MLDLDGLAKYHSIDGRIKGCTRSKRLLGKFASGMRKMAFSLVVTSSYVLSIGSLVFLKERSLYGNIGWSLWGRLSYFVVVIVCLYHIHFGLAS